MVGAKLWLLLTLGFTEVNRASCGKDIYLLEQALEALFVPGILEWHLHLSSGVSRRKSGGCEGRRLRLSPQISDASVFPQGKDTLVGFILIALAF